MAEFLQFFVWLPLLGFLLCLIIPAKNEKRIAGVVITTAGLHLVALASFIVFWWMHGAPILNQKHITLFQSDTIEIFIDLYFDAIGAVFTFTGAVITLLVAIFSKYYLHRDQGFKRYFSTVIFFFLNYTLLILSGNFETLFIGWEFLGICSFLLISFYRDRYLPVKNSLKVLSIFRIGDICLILAMWMSHHLWKQNITFLQLSDAPALALHIAEHSGYAWFIALTIIIAAAVKSAQLPFSSWLPRAMEGPTSSSALFYGSLSVHLGVFLLMRTAPYWQSIDYMDTLVIVIGAATALIGTSIAKAQSSVKVQIAYSSAAQIGLMFIEVALGWHTLALVHFAANALLRTYQLLVSPSVMSYLMHDMFFSFVPRVRPASSPFLTKVSNTLYILALKEWNMDTLLTNYLWNPFKWMGRKIAFVSYRTTVVVFPVLFAIGFYFVINPETIPLDDYDVVPSVYAVVGLLYIIKALSEREDALHAWLSVIGAELLIILSVAIHNQDFTPLQMLIVFSGMIVSSVVGYITLRRIKAFDNDLSLNYYHGYSYEHPGLAFVFLLSCLGLVGLPFTPTFIGIDVLFSHIHKHQELQIFFTAMSFMIIEISVLRIYARIFTGMHKKSYHAMAYRSS